MRHLGLCGNGAIEGERQYPMLGSDQGTVKLATAKAVTKIRAFNRSSMRRLLHEAVNRRRGCARGRRAGESARGSRVHFIGRNQWMYPQLAQAEQCAVSPSHSIRKNVATSVWSCASRR